MSSDCEGNCIENPQQHGQNIQTFYDLQFLNSKIKLVIFLYSMSLCMTLSSVPFEPGDAQSIPAGAPQKTLYFSQFMNKQEVNTNISERKKKNLFWVPLTRMLVKT